MIGQPAELSNRLFPRGGGASVTKSSSQSQIIFGKTIGAKMFFLALSNSSNSLYQLLFKIQVITLRALIFAGIIFPKFSRNLPFSRKLMPHKNFQTLWSHEILGFLPKSPRKIKKFGKKQLNSRKLIL